MDKSTFYNLWWECPSKFLFNFYEISLKVLHIKEVMKNECYFKTFYMCLHENGKNINKVKW